MDLNYTAHFNNITGLINNSTSTFSRFGTEVLPDMIEGFVSQWIFILILVVVILMFVWYRR